MVESVSLWKNWVVVSDARRVGRAYFKTTRWYLEDRRRRPCPLYPWLEVAPLPARELPQG